MARALINRVFRGHGRAECFSLVSGPSCAFIDRRRDRRWEFYVIRRHFFLFAAAVVLLIMIVVGGIKLATAGDVKPGGRGGPGGRSTQVSVTTVVARAFVDKVSVLGVAKGRQSVTITSSTAELVTAVNFRDGQTVSKGQVLVTLKANEQDADVAEAQARENQAERDYARWNTLAQKGVAPRATAEQYLASLESARAATAAAKARRLDRVIRAPFSGVVGLSDVAPGALINAGSPIVSLDDLSLIRVDFDVPDRYLSVLREGASIIASPDAYPEEKITGRIAKLDSRINTATRAITARAEFQNAGGRLRPGMLMQVAVEHGARDALAVPESAVQYEGDTAFVFSILTREGKTTVRKVQVTPGVSEGGFVEIREGLKANEKVVADGLNRLTDGAPVSLPGQRPPGVGGKSGKKGAN
jgi:membrane fusion protein (multidrug efflux system)